MASSKCKHSKRKPGKKRMPARWGSYATEVCTTCGAWRIVSHVPGRWNPAGTNFNDLSFVEPGSTSILQTGGCNCHFYIQNGQIRFC